jgi:hypothetical protein
MADPKWKEFEKLVEKVYKKLSPEAKIEHDVKIRGIETGKNRQIDICIRQDDHFQSGGSINGNI